MDLILSDRAIKDLPEAIDISRLNVHGCTGCFGCWTKTPGRCVIRDDAPSLYPRIAAADRIMIITKLYLGCYDIPMKKVIERALPNQQAFIRIYKGETHHLQRNVIPKKLTVIAYGEYSDEEKELFRCFLARNSINFIAEETKILWAEDGSEADALALKEAELWQSC